MYASRVETDLILGQVTVLRESYRLASPEGEKMKYKPTIAATLVLTLVTAAWIFHEISTAPPAGWLIGEGTKMFRFQETEPSEPYLELAEPLDKWTTQAIQNTTQCVFVSEPYWNQCQITNSNATVFKYGERFYTAPIWASRPVHFHADPTRETGSGMVIRSRKTVYSQEKPCYELSDPLDPWTEAALQDVINTVYVDDIYLDDCALWELGLKNTWPRSPIFKYHNEYYAILVGFYDSFSPRPLVEIVLVLAWLALGVVWLGSGVRNLVQEIRGRKT